MMATSKPMPEANIEGQAESVRVYTPLQAHLLERLVQLVERRQELAAESDGNPGRSLNLIQKAIFAAYIDCLEEGVGAEALDILQGESLASAA